LRWCICGSDEQRAFEAAIDERRGAIKAVRPIDVFRQYRLRKEIGRAIERVATSVPGEGPAPVLVLTDMFGGTPANLGVTYVGDAVEVITGVNLPMLIKLARPQQATDLLSLAREMREHGRNAIWVASDLLRGEKS